MKLRYCAILLFSFLFYSQTSSADINVKKCKVNKSDYISFDERDSKISENLIDSILHNQPEKRETAIIKIFANENGDDRNYWLAVFNFADDSHQYLFFQADKDKPVEINKKQFDELFPKVVGCNQNKDVPIYSENVDAD